MPNPKPASLPRWADVGGGAGIAVPAAGNLDTGWFVKQKMPAQWLNWLFNLIYQWCAYLFDFENNLHTWAGKQTFNHNTLFFAGTQEWNAASPWLTIDNNPIGVGSASRQAIYIIGKTGIDPSLSLAGGVISITNADIGACLRASNSATGGVAAWLNNTGDSSTALKIFENAGDHLGVALDIILTSSNGTALQAVGASGSAFLALFSNNGGAPALKVENTGAGKALEIGAGHAHLSGGNVAGNTAQANMLSPGLVPKAWALVTTNTGADPTILASQNVASVSRTPLVIGSNPAANGLRVTLASGLASANGGWGMGAGVQPGGPLTPIEALCLVATATLFDFILTDDASFIDSNTVGTRVFLVIYGLQ